MVFFVPDDDVSDVTYNVSSESDDRDEHVSISSKKTVSTTQEFSSPLFVPENNKPMSSYGVTDSFFSRMSNFSSSRVHILLSTVLIICLIYVFGQVYDQSRSTVLENSNTDVQEVLKNLQKFLFLRDVYPVVNWHTEPGYVAVLKEGKQWKKYLKKPLEDVSAAKYNGEGLKKKTLANMPKHRKNFTYHGIQKLEVAVHDKLGEAVIGFQRWIKKKQLFARDIPNESETSFTKKCSTKLDSLPTQQVSTPFSIPSSTLAQEGSDKLKLKKKMRKEPTPGIAVDVQLAVRKHVDSILEDKYLRKRRWNTKLRSKKF